jgi:hypothetical protein
MSIITATSQEILNELTDMQNFLELPFDGDNPELTVERANYLEQIMARSGKLVADAEYHRDTFLSSEITKVIKEALNEAKWPASITSKKIDAMAKDYNYCCKWSERVNRTATHAHQFCITLISKMKAEMQMNGTRNY